jgi:hypothetical protein
MVTNPPVIEFFHGSFLSPPTDPDSDSDCSWADADLVFANSTCFPDELIANIAEKCVSLSVGARVITFTTSLRSEYFKVTYPLHILLICSDIIQKTPIHVLGTGYCLHP